MTDVVTDGESNFSRDFSMEIMLLWLYFLVVTRCLLLHPGCYVIVGKWLMVEWLTSWFTCSFTGNGTSSTVKGQ